MVEMADSKGNADDASLKRLQQSIEETVGNLWQCAVIVEDGEFGPGVANVLQNKMYC